MSRRTIHLQRAYEAPGPDDGYRVLVDRLWPRGVRRDALHMNEWCKELALSTELRHWFGHDPELWDEFQVRYRAELADNPEVARLAGVARGGVLTLLYGAADTEHNQAVVLRDAIGELLDKD